LKVDTETQIGKKAKRMKKMKTQKKEHDLNIHSVSGRLRSEDESGRASVIDIQSWIRIASEERMDWIEVESSRRQSAK